MAQRPRILHLHSSFNLGGKEARAVRLMNLWGDRLEHSVISGVPSMMGARSEIGAHVPVAFPDDAPPLTGRPDPRRWRAIARYMQRFDLVLTYNWGAMDGVMARRFWAPFMKLPPLIHHEDGFNEDEAEKLNPRRNLYRRVALAGANALAVPSERLERIALHDWRQPRGKVHLIRNGIDIARYAVPPAPGAIPGFVRQPGKIVIGTIAGLRAVKNLRRLVRASARHDARVQLVIAGEGPEREAIIAEAAACGFTGLHMAGFLPEPHRYVGMFDIFALSSDSEQFPISLVEAMAAGLPAISTDVGDVAAMVTPENLPYVVPISDESAFSDAISTLSAHESLRRAIGEANRIRAAALFTEEQMLRSYAQLYGAALSTPEIFA